MIKYLFFK